MSFDNTKNYLRNRMEGLGYAESKEPFTFENASAREFGKTFILRILEGEGSMDLNTEFIDQQTWSVSIAFKRSDHNDVINRDDMYRSIEAIIKDLDNPSNYVGTIRLMRYSNWIVEEEENYFLLRITIEIQDRITY